LTLKNRNLRNLAVNLFKAPPKEAKANIDKEVKTDKEAAVITSQEAVASTSQEEMANTSQEVAVNAVVVVVAIKMKRRNNTKSVKTAVTAEAVNVEAEAEVPSHQRNSMMSMAWKRSTIPSNSPPETTERRSHMIVRHQKRKKSIHPESMGRKRSTSPRIDPKVKIAKAIDHKANVGPVAEAAVAVKAVVVVKAAVTEATGQPNHKKSL
jgi:hypothetical protein